MFEALRCVRGTKALNFSVFLIPNLAHPLIRWVPEEPGSSPHGGEVIVIFYGLSFFRDKMM